MLKKLFSEEEYKILKEIKDVVLSNNFGSFKNIEYLLLAVNYAFQKTFKIL